MISGWPLRFFLKSKPRILVLKSDAADEGSSVSHAVSRAVNTKIKVSWPAGKHLNRLGVSETHQPGSDPVK